MSKMVGESNMDNAMTFSALIVENNNVASMIEKVLLGKKGFKTTVVENGQEAVNIIREGNSFDVVIMDMEMPVMNGIQATKELRAMGVKCLIFGLTSSESKSGIQDFIEAGLDEYFPKPLDYVKIDNILKCLEE